MGLSSIRALFLFSVLALPPVLYSVEEDKLYRHCGNHFCNDKVGYIRFPFKSITQPSECGLFTVNCSDHRRPKIQLKEGGYSYEFEGPLTTLIRIKNSDLGQLFGKDPCNDEVFDDLSLPSPPPELGLVFITHNLTLFKCNTTLDLDEPSSKNLTCKSPKYTYYTSPFNNSLPNPPPPCSMSQIPFLGDDRSAWTADFFIQVLTPQCYECHGKEGECLVYDGRFVCSKGDKNLPLKLGLGIGLGFPALFAVCLLLLWLYKQKRSSLFLSRNISSQPYINSDIEGCSAYFGVPVFTCCFFWKKRIQKHQIVEAFLRSHGPLQVRRYSYSEVKKMTNFFKQKLGQGGCGAVYKGKLKDGGLVAVKVLTKLKGDGEEFMNEVAAISRTSHVNIVFLLGYCFEGSKRALVYEFMPNGSLEKFIFDANTPNKGHDHLGWEALDRISLGIARGLEYLHRGCNTRILHFDIKPHNILLDENFTPKISDFGLARICNRKESILSMSGVRGTAGYIAPEVFCRNFGGVSHKSDVYSYGMMLSEMVGGRRNIDAEAENTSEIYFPHWIYKRVELDEELGLQSVTNEEDKARARKMIIVSLWCIQTDPSNRPSMKEVIDMLEGSVDSLQIPPKPYLSSPPKSPADSSTTLVSIQ